jgi:RimJ/RimL family protein N-acetyltransferase
MEQGKIVFEGLSRQGKSILIRYIQKNDTEALCHYMNTLSEERTFVRFQGEQLTLEEETAYINGQLQRIENNQTVHLVAFCEGTLVGVAGLDMKGMAEKHVGEFGISIAKTYRGKGIGSLLMETVLKEAEANIPQLRIIMLEVFSDNTLAIAMYKKLGFVEYGRLPKGVLHNNDYVDTVYMYRKVSYLKRSEGAISDAIPGS